MQYSREAPYRRVFFVHTSIFLVWLAGAQVQNTTLYSCKTVYIAIMVEYAVEDSFEFRNWFPMPRMMQFMVQQEQKLVVSSSNQYYYDQPHPYRYIYDDPFAYIYIWTHLTWRTSSTSSRSSFTQRDKLPTLLHPSKLLYFHYKTPSTPATRLCDAFFSSPTFFIRIFIHERKIKRWHIFSKFFFSILIANWKTIIWLNSFAIRKNPTVKIEKSWNCVNLHFSFEFHFHVIFSWKKKATIWDFQRWNLQLFVGQVPTRFRDKWQEEKNGSLPWVIWKRVARANTRVEFNSRYIWKHMEMVLHSKTGANARVCFFFFNTSVIWTREENNRAWKSERIHHELWFELIIAKTRTRP